MKRLGNQSGLRTVQPKTAEDGRSEAAADVERHRDDVATTGTGMMRIVADDTYDDKWDSIYMRTALLRALVLAFVTTTGASAQALEGPDPGSSIPEILTGPTRSEAPTLEAVPVTGAEPRIERLHDQGELLAESVTGRVEEVGQA